MCARVCLRARARACACNERVRVHRFLCVCVCVCSECVWFYARSFVRTLMCPSTRAFISAHVRGFVHFHRVAFSRVCVCDGCVCSERVCAPRRSACPLVARRRLAVLIARPAPHIAAARAWLRFGAIGRARARLPQVSPGRAALPRRDGLAEFCTRPWSTPPAPSTSSAAKLTSAAPTASPTMTSGRAPTEVRCRTRSRGRSRGTRGGYSRGYSGVLRGTKGILGGTQGVYGATQGVLQGYHGGT